MSSPIKYITEVFLNEEEEQFLVWLLPHGRYWVRIEDVPLRWHQKVNSAVETCNSFGLIHSYLSIKGQGVQLTDIGIDIANQVKKRKGL